MKTAFTLCLLLTPILASAQSALQNDSGSAVERQRREQVDRCVEEHLAASGRSEVSVRNLCVKMIGPAPGAR